MNIALYINIGILCYTLAGLVYATAQILKYNKAYTKVLLGIYGMYASTIIYVACVLLYEITGNIYYNIASKVIFIIFLTIAMPWSTTVYMKLTDKAHKEKG